MPQYEYSRTEPLQVTATTISQQVNFSQDVFVIEIFNLSNHYVYVNEEGNNPALVALHSPVFPANSNGAGRPLVIKRNIRQEWGISVITQNGTADLRIVGRF